jgi:hypoxanthine phosphoribosyltransferase
MSLGYIFYMAKIPAALSPIVNIRGIDRYRPSMEEVRGLGWSIGEAVLRSSFDIHQIVSITRGGLTPTDCISRSMGIKDIQTLAIERYEAEPDDSSNPVAVEEFKIYQLPKLRKLGRGALFVDDIVDKAMTAEFVQARWPEAAIASIYTKLDHDESMKKVDFYGKYVGDIWVDLPWEVEEQNRSELRQEPNRVIY